MMRALIITLMLGIAAGITKVQMETKYADPNVAVKETKRLCDSGDMDAALDVLEAHGKPIGFSKGKEIFRTCFFEDVTGECLLGKAKCEWMRKCLKSEGACEQPPIAEAFIELPGGKAVLEELQAEVNSSTSAPILKLTEAAKKISMAFRGPSALVQKNTEAQTMMAPTTPKTELEKLNAEAKKNLNQLKRSLGMMSGLRNQFFEYLPEKFQRSFALDVIALPMFARVACATTFTQKFDEETGKPLYGNYAPLGPDGPKYTAPLYDMEFAKARNLKDWFCQYPTKLKKWQKREIEEAEKKKLQKIDETLPGPERKQFRKWRKEKEDKSRPIGIPDKDPTYRAMSQR